MIQIRQDISITTIQSCDSSDPLKFRDCLTAAFVETETSLAAWQQQKQAVRLEAAISQWAQLTDLPKTLA